MSKPKKKHPDHLSKEERRAYNKKYRETHKEHITELKRKWRENHREQVREAARKRYKLNPESAESIKARRSTQQHRAGDYVYRHPELRGATCEFCGATDRIRAHHPDYDEPHIVVTTCGACHKWVHEAWNT